MEVLELSGTYFEIGEKWGHAIKDDLFSSMHAEIGGLAQFFQTDKQDLITKASSFLPKAKDYDSHFIEVLQGLAKGAQVPFDQVFALRSLLKEAFSIHQIPALCTAFAATGNATNNGQTIIGQNMDWHPDSPVNLGAAKSIRGTKRAPKTR